MLILGIETSERAGQIALMRDGALLEERELPGGGRRHAQSLVAEIGSLLERHGAGPRDVGAVAVSVGPGSFTGLRVGVVCAKTFAYAAGCRLAAVGTFDVIAANAPEDVAAVWVLGDAQRGELYVGRYERGAGGEFAAAGEIRIVDGASWCAGRGAGDSVTGPGVVRWERELAARCRVLPDELRHPRASVVARLGAARVAASGGDDVWGLEPLYVRKSAAEEKWDAAQSGGTV